MTERATSRSGLVASDHGLSCATAKRAGASPRELARRLSGTDEIRLLWHPESDRVELSICDVTTREGFHIEVRSGSAMEAFHHPYAYAATAENDG